MCACPKKFNCLSREVPQTPNIENCNLTILIFIIVNIFIVIGKELINQGNYACFHIFRQLNELDYLRVTRKLLVELYIL